LANPPAKAKSRFGGGWKSDALSRDDEVTLRLCTPILMQAKIVECGFATTSIQRRDFRTSLNIALQKAKLNRFWSGRCKIFADEMILELRLARLKTVDT